MSWAAAPRRALLSLSLLVAAVAAPGPAGAQSLPPPEGPEAWLVTYGPGEIYWQRFGHNAIWLREPGGLDHTFNFGFFDFEQESFLLRFVQGRMLYFAAAVPAEREMALYAEEGREIRVQRLALQPETYARLREHLLWHVQPENREYLYDYYLDNCSTRLRDALDLALGGALSEQFGERAATQNFRDHTRRSTQMDRAYYLGLVAALGLPVDRSISRWDEMFLPAVLADSLGALLLVEEGEASIDKVVTHVVTEDRILLPGRVIEPPATPGRTWPLYGALGLGLLGLVALLWVAAARAGRSAAMEGFVLAWLLISGTLGVGLVLVWGFTDHLAAYPNLNLLLLNPLWLLGLVPALRQSTSWLLLAGTGAAVVAAVWPSGQYLADTLAFIAPLNLAVAWRLRRPWSEASVPSPRAT